MYQILLNPNRPVIRSVLNACHPYWPAILELRHLGYSLVETDRAFSWQGPVPGLARLCDLFSVDIENRPLLAAGQPLWHERRAKLVDLSTKSHSLSPDDERLRQVLSGLLGEYVATIERRRYIADPVSPAVLPVELEGQRLLLDCCLSIESMHDALPATDDSHFFSLKAFVNHACERHLGRSQPVPKFAEVERELAFAAGY
ncbi:TPA: hypothetical protein DEP96_03695 [Candidatus Uhrbacteria bacterium]|nr:hypothetical protein [Candidatus Uhrbacteria bacterium]